MSPRVEPYFTNRQPLLPEILDLHGKWLGSKEAVVVGDLRLTWFEFLARINRLANGLIAEGLQPGQAVAVVMSNGLPMLETLFGVLMAGGVSVPLNLTITPDAACEMIRDSGAVAVVATGDQLNALKMARQDASLCVTHWYLSGDRVGDDTSESWASLEALKDDQPTGRPSVSLHDDDVLNVIYSSGTTGVPKGIVHTHRGRRDWAYDLAIALRYHGGARTLLTLGLYSNVSWVGMLCTLLAGGTIYVHEGFDALKFLQTVQKESITHTAMVPIQYQRILDCPGQENFDSTSLTAVMSCGSALHESLKRRLFERFDCGVIELYGLTEGIITTLEPEEAPGRWGSAGKPLIGTDLKIVDDLDREICDGSPGEIVATGRIVMPGYLHREQANLENTWVDHRGARWLRSGDIGRLDDEGYLYLVDRKKDMILSGSQNIYPQDIEAVLARHSDVREVAVIGVNSRRWGETPLGLVVTTRDAETTEQELMDWCNQKLGRQQRLAGLIYVPELPRNPNGKILKKKLRQTYGDKLYD